MQGVVVLAGSHLLNFGVLVPDPLLKGICVALVLVAELLVLVGLLPEHSSGALELIGQLVLGGLLLDVELLVLLDFDDGLLQLLHLLLALLDQEVKPLDLILEVLLVFHGELLDALEFGVGVLEDLDLRGDVGVLGFPLLALDCAFAHQDAEAVDFALVGDELPLELSYFVRVLDVGNLFGLAAEPAQLDGELLDLLFEVLALASPVVYFFPVIDNLDDFVDFDGGLDVLLDDFSLLVAISDLAELRLLSDDDKILFGRNQLVALLLRRAAASVHSI